MSKPYSTELFFSQIDLIGMCCKYTIEISIEICIYGFFQADKNFLLELYATVVATFKIKRI